MSTRKLRAELLTLTPELCQEFSTMPQLPGERDLKESHVDFLDRHLTDGTFISPTWSVATVKGTTQQLRCDGQHSSTLLARIATHEPERFPEGLPVTIQYFEIDSVEQDAANLFNLFDNPKSSRTNTDVMSVFRAQHELLKTMDNSFLVEIARGINFYLDDLIDDIKKEYEKTATKAAKKGLPAPPRPQLPLTHQARQYGLYWDEPEYREFTQWVRQWSDSRCRWILAKPGVVAQILDSWKAVPQRAQRYWDFVFSENHPDPEHASRRLVLKLRALTAKPRPKADEFRSLAEESWATYLHKEPEEQEVPEREVSLSAV
jgi:hypothetical protein